MSRIRGINTTPEIRLRKALYKAGLRGYRIHYKLLGKPDIIFISKRLVIFVDGDFWHGYLWNKKKKVPPKVYWQEKINGNIIRDAKNNTLLRKQGWKVMRFWEHQVVKSPERIAKRINQYLEQI